MTDGITRKELFSRIFGAVREVGERAATARKPSTPPLRPPGALQPDAAYLAACTGCEKCIPVCPPGALFMTEASGPDDTPRRVAVLHPERKPCTLCTELPCIRACPEGALEHVAEPRDVRIGVAQVLPLNCRTFRGRSCDLCVRICPFPDVAIRSVNGKPVVMPQGCTGCGGGTTPRRQ